MKHLLSSSFEKKLFTTLFFFITISFYTGYVAQLFFCDESSLLCLGKRGCLLGILWTMSLALFYGITIRTYAIAFSFLLSGIILSLYQACGYVCASPEGGLRQFFSLSSYSWSTLLFSFSSLALAAIMTTHKAGLQKRKGEISLSDKIALYLTMITTAFVALDIRF